MNNDNYGGLISEQFAAMTTKLIDPLVSISKWRKYLPIISVGTFDTGVLRDSIIHMTGSAKIIGDYSDDLPSSDAYSSKSEYPIRIVGSSYEYSFTEANKIIQGVNITVDDVRATAAIRSHEQLFNKIAFDGSPNFGIPGLLGGEIPTTPTPIVGGNQTWASKTPQQVKSEIVSYFIGEVIENSDDEMPPTRILLSKVLYDYLSSTYMHANTERTILEAAVESLIAAGVINSGADFAGLKSLDGKGIGGTNVMIGINSSPDSIAFNLAENPRPLDAINMGLHWKVPIVSAISGTLIRRPNNHLVMFGM